MHVPFIQGKQIFLRPLERADLNENYLAWLNDPDVNTYLETGLFPNTLDSLEQFYAQVTADRSQVILAIVERETMLHIGNVKLGPIDWLHRRATFGILLGDKQFWGRGISTEVTRLMIEYGFFRLNLRRIDLGVYAEHTAAVRLYEKVGFRLEGRLREHTFHRGAYKDILLMAMLRAEYQGQPEDQPA